VRNLLSQVLDPKHVYSTSLRLSANNWGPRRRTPLTKGLIIPQKVLHRITLAP
jgi:hypothetical protein